jgi:hypothetical protein
MSIREPNTFFPELDGDERRAADRWLHDYLRLVIRIYQDSLRSSDSGCPQVEFDESRGTGTLSTAESGRLSSL